MHVGKQPQFDLLRIIKELYDEVASQQTNNSDINLVEGKLEATLHELSVHQKELHTMNESLQQEIKRRKYAELQLAATKKILDITLHGIGEGIITTDTEGNGIFLNEAAERLNGWSKQDAEGNSIEEVFNIFDEASLNTKNNPVAEVLASGEPSELTNHTVLRERTGRERIIEHRALPINDKNEKNGGAVLVIRDVTRQPMIKCGGRILVMVDEEILRNLSIILLGRMGFKVITAADGNEALKLLEEAANKKKPFHAVIMDLTVPGDMGGKETIQKLRRVAPYIKTGDSSGYSNDPVMADHKKYGLNDVISKPFQVYELGHVLKKLIN